MDALASVIRHILLTEIISACMNYDQRHQLVKIIRQCEISMHTTIKFDHFDFSLHKITVIPFSLIELFGAYRR